MNTYQREYVHVVHITPTRTNTFNLQAFQHVDTLRTLLLFQIPAQLTKKLHCIVVLAEMSKTWCVLCEVCGLGVIHRTKESEYHKVTKF